MKRFAPWLLSPLAALFVLTVWQGPQSPAFKPGGPVTTVIRPLERRR